MISIGQLLVESGLITPQELDTALAKQNNADENPERLKLGDMVLKLGYVSETQLLHALSTRLNIPFGDLASAKIDSEAAGKIPQNIAREHECVAFAIVSGRLQVAINDPDKFVILDELKELTGMEIQPVLAARASILNAIDKIYT
ncbi:MAG: hypothetical protein FWH20_07855 [Oscillospiraceae bacterium]|nr:hypothetical protein [Oscillospiraceae bacterium]